MIKCNITACGTISRDASMRTTKEDKTFLTFPLRIVIQGKDGRNETVEISVSKEGAQKKVSSYRNGLREEVAGTLFLKRRGEKLYFNLFADRIATAKDIADSIKGELSFRGKVGKNDIVITIEMKKEYLTQGFLQRLGNNGIINGFLINALSSEAAHDQYLLFHNREETPIHAVIQSILCESYDPQICGDKMIDAYMIVLFCKILRQYRSQSFSPKAKSQWKIVDILDYLEANYLTVTLQSTADHFGFHPNYLSAFIKKETGRTFKELVILQKMCQACFYLTNTDFPIYEIAQKVGYDNLGFFYRKFTELYHMTPQEFRERKAYA